MQNIFRLCLCICTLHMAADMRASYDDYIIPITGITAATGIISYGIHLYSSWCERRNVEDVYTQARDVITNIQDRYQPLITAWHQRDAYAYADLVRHMTSTLQPFEDGYAELQAQLTTLETLIHRADALRHMDTYPELAIDLSHMVAAGQELAATLQDILQHCTRNYGQYMLHDTLYGSRHLVPYYQVIITYNQEYPDPDRRHYVDTALMSQYASARLHWPRLYAVDQMHQHIKAIERGQALIQQEIDMHSNTLEQQFSRDLLQTAEYMLYHLKDIHMYLTTLPGYHAERDGHYQEQREKEHEARIEAQYEQKVQAERDRAQAERERAEAENQRSRETKHANTLREKALNWGIKNLPEIRSDLEDLAYACRHGRLDRRELERELDAIIRKMPEPRGSIIAGIELLLEQCA